MTRLALLTVAALLITGGCSRPEPPTTKAAPTPIPLDLKVYVFAPEGAGPEANSWAEELRAAAGLAGLSLATAADAAVIVVRVDAVTKAGQTTQVPEGNGDVEVVKGAVILKEESKSFDLSYRGDSLPQAEAFAQRLRLLADAVPPQDRLFGRWLPAREGESREALSPTDEQIRQLESIGYLSGSEPAGPRIGVTLHDQARSYEGVNLYASGHRPTATLMDMSGRVLHQWEKPFGKVWPHKQADAALEHTQCWRRVHLFPNGDLIAIYNGHGMIRLDKDSNLLWASYERQHHDFEVLPDGKILTLTRKAHRSPAVGNGEIILEDFVSLLAADGKELERTSLIQCFNNSPEFHHLYPGSGRVWQGDVFHTNSLRILDGRLEGRAPQFKRGRILVSILRLDTIAVIDLESATVVWAQTGPFRRQHDPRILASNNILIFDNHGGDPALGGSRVLELDPRSREVVWEYAGTPSKPFRSDECGMAYRLPNGNTFINESNFGRAFEVTGEGEIVWEFLNPHRAGPRNEYVATLFDIVRLDPDQYPFLDQ